MGVGFIEVIDGPAVGGDETLKLPVAAKNIFEQKVAGACWFTVDGIIGTHDGICSAFYDSGAKCREISVPKIMRTGINVGFVASGLGATVDGVVLRSGDGAVILGIVALQALDEGGAKRRGQIGVFAVGLLATSPAWIAKDINIWRPDGEPEINGVDVMADGFVVLGAGLDGDDLAYF